MAANTDMLGEQSLPALENNEASLPVSGCMLDSHLIYHYPRMSALNRTTNLVVQN